MAEEVTMFNQNDGVYFRFRRCEDFIQNDGVCFRFTRTLRAFQLKKTEKRAAGYTFNTCENFILRLGFFPVL